jgi:hypothetical protein
MREVVEMVGFVRKIADEQVIGPIVESDASRSQQKTGR